jgi:CBS domain-containing protein
MLDLIEEPEFRIHFSPAKGQRTFSPSTSPGSNSDATILSRRPLERSEEMNRCGIEGANAGSRPRGRASVKIRDVMTPDIEVVTPEDTLKTAVQLMADLDYDALPVSDDKQLLGVITSRDVAVQVVAKNQGASEITVGEAMSSDVLYCFENEPVNTVARKMSDWWVRRLPVVKQNKRLIGTVTLGDLAGLETTAPSEVEMSSQRLQATRPRRRIRRGRRVAVAA